MKKLSLIALACMMVLGLAQCKKNEPTNNNNAGNADRVNITLTLDNGGQRVHPEEVPETGWAKIVYDNNDVVYVGSGGKYMGYLTYNGSVFTGSINAEATVGQPLQFILMGGQDFHGSLTENSTTEYIFNIGNQSDDLAVISCAASNENFSATKLDYTATLRNKCALVKFDLGEVSADAAITLTGVKTEATIGFDGTVTNGTATGDIATYGTGSTRYAVVLSDQAEVAEGTISAEGYEGTFSIPTAAYTNAFLTNATMTLTATSSVPTGAIKGLFTVSDKEEGTNTYQIYFSKGNLQYQASTDTWQFAEHQWDYIGSDNSNISSTYSGWIDLFGWGTSGYHNNNDSYNVNYYPWSNSTSSVNNGYNSYGYGPSMDQPDQALVRTSAQYDWGVHNPISNGGNQVGQWKTMTRYAWKYIFETRSTPSDIRYAKAKVNDVNGVILLPDDWSSETYSLSNTNSGGASFSSNIISASQWNTLEQAGAVFLPAAEYRYGTTVSEGNGGRYWSASQEDKDQAKGMYFNASKIETYKKCPRYHGLSVRLVHVVEN